MDTIKSCIRCFVDTCFPNSSPEQKQKYLKKLHYIGIVSSPILIIFSPSRSFTRYFTMCMVLISAWLYFTYDVCIVTEVEKEFFVSEEHVPVSVTIAELINADISDVSTDTLTRTIYAAGCIVMTCIVIRDWVGVY